MSDVSVEEDLLALGAMSTEELCRRYRELFGQPVRTRHKAYLVRKIAWRVQANAEGDLSDRARRRAAELADDADVRVMPPRDTRPVLSSPRGGRRVVAAPAAPAAAPDPRLPPPGTSLLREYKGKRVEVRVTADGLEYDGARFKTLSAVAKRITGSHLNGFRFFKLETRP